MKAELRKMLAQISPEEVEKEAQDLETSAKEDLDEAKRLFAIAKALRGEASALAASGGDSSRNGTTPAPRPSNKRPLIEQIIGERPLPAWAPKEVHSTLVAREMVDPGTTLESIRVNLSRMAEKYHQLVRTDDGYTLPDYEKGGQL